MTSDSWPNGVATESDNCQFLKLLFANAPREDLTKLLPTWSWDRGIFKSCFLTFVSGIHHVNDLKMIEVSFNIFNDQMNWEAQNGQMFQAADRIHDVTGSKKAARYYRQATLNGNNCDCRISFGGDDRWRKATCPRAASAHLHGQMFQNCLMKNMKKNHQDFFPKETALPHWLQHGTFHVLFNEYTHLEGNSIDFHDDAGETYSFLDPICSFTFKSPGILLVKRKSESKGKTEKYEASILLLFQNPGDCVVMSGFCQQFYQHAVPARHKGADIHKTKEYEGVLIRSDDEHWSQFSNFLDSLQQDPAARDAQVASPCWASKLMSIIFQEPKTSLQTT